MSLPQMTTQDLITRKCFQENLCQNPARRSSHFVVSNAVIQSFTVSQWDNQTPLKLRGVIV